MEKRVVSLLGGSFFLILAGVVLYLWSLFDPSDGSAAGALPIALIILGGLGLNISWVLHDVVERLQRLERSREERVTSAKAREAEPAAPAGGPRG
jgi:hypothetical protein